MRPRVLAAALLLLASASAGAQAQVPVTGFEPRTGDVWVDTRLSDINRYASTYREPFVDELVRYKGAPRELVAELLARPGWTPADVYYACSLATAVGRPCRFVVDEYERDRAEGWGALAKRLGVDPGSPAFHRLKRGFVPTYDRWSRPIQLDADLERAFPGRSRSKTSAPGGPMGKPVHGKAGNPRASSGPGNSGRAGPLPAAESGTSGAKGSKNDAVGGDRPAKATPSKAGKGQRKEKRPVGGRD